LIDDIYRTITIPTKSVTKVAGLVCSRAILVVFVSSNCWLQYCTLNTSGNKFSKRQLFFRDQWQASRECNGDTHRPIGVPSTVEVCMCLVLSL
jgi:hypothetical protein